MDSFRRWRKAGDLLMEYKKGSIVNKSGTVFDNGDVDPRFSHPTLIPIARDNVMDDVYYLIITSKVGKYNLYEEQFYLIDEDMVEMAHLDSPSMVNLREIHKTRDFGKIKGGLPPFLYKEVIRKFKAYQELHPHEHYEEVKNLIK